MKLHLNQTCNHAGIMVISKINHKMKIIKCNFFTRSPETPLLWCLLLVSLCKVLSHKYSQPKFLRSQCWSASASNRATFFILIYDDIASLLHIFLISSNRYLHWRMSKHWQNKKSYIEIHTGVFQWAFLTINSTRCTRRSCRTLNINSHVIACFSEKFLSKQKQLSDSDSGVFLLH